MKNYKKRKKSTIDWILTSKKVRISILIAAALMVFCTIFVSYQILGNYDGLGLRHPQETNDYDKDSFYDENGLRKYEDGTIHSACGIDVSVYQGDIDWEKVKAAGVDFVMIRLGYRASESGNIQMDSQFKSSLRGAKAAGLDIGVYFFSQAVTTDEAIEEARYVVRHIRGKGISYPVAFDMEPVEGAKRITNLTKEEKTQIADAFCRVIDRNGYTPMIYGNLQWLEKHIDMEYLTDYPLWLAHYAESTTYPYQYKMWQYSDRGKIDGIEGSVDLNLYFYQE